MLDLEVLSPSSSPFIIIISWSRKALLRLAGETYSRGIFTSGNARRGHCCIFVQRGQAQKIEGNTCLSFVNMVINCTVIDGLAIFNTVKYYIIFIFERL